MTNKSFSQNKFIQVHLIHFFAKHFQKMSDKCGADLQNAVSPNTKNGKIERVISTTCKLNKKKNLVFCLETKWTKSSLQLDKQAFHCILGIIVKKIQNVFDK